MLIQTTLIAMLVLSFTGKATECLVYMAVQGVLLWYLFLSGMVPYDLVWGLQAANMPIVATSKVRALSYMYYYKER